MVWDEGTPPYPSGTSNAYNSRIPDLQVPGDYPYIRFYQFRDGSWERIDETPGHESRSHGHITGSFEETDFQGSHKHLQVGFQHNYTTQGKSETTEGNHDHKVGGSTVQYVSGDHYAEHAGDHMKAVGGDVIHATGGTLFMHGTNGSEMTSTGNHVSDHNDGSHYVNIEGDKITFNQGTKYDFVGQDHGSYVAGAKDTHVANNCNLESDTQVTITVGKSVITVKGDSIIIHDGNGNEMGMNAQQLWVGNPQNYNIPVYLGGNGSNQSLYAPVATLSGPAINVFAKYVQQQG